MAIPLTFGNHLKFGPGSCHNAKGKPTFLHRERERAPKAPCKARTCTTSHIEKGPPMGPCARGSCWHSGWSNEGMVVAVFLLSRSTRLSHAKYCKTTLELVGILKSCPSMLARIKAPSKKAFTTYGPS